ncbi:MAG: exodeoxyribonuclease VII large subunit [Candidatus Cryptobacteroides sp.]
MEKEIINLYDLQSVLKSGIECLFPSKVWIRAEISALKARPGGHCYLELSQSDGKSLVAKAQAAIWSSRYRVIAPYFESVTGSPLKEGLTVLVRAQVTYSQLYGLTISIDDIDPEYSLGESERQRLQTIERLKDEGLMDLQKSLQEPSLPQRFAVISAQDAAGYRDFMKHLHENEYGFSFTTELFPALMQGPDAPSSMADALESVLSSGEEFDMVLILRGGGSRLDLACYDDYLLCSAIARCPLPVMTAVGHDQDYHICDMVSFRSLKTPTALADEIISIYADEDARLLDFGSRLRLAFLSKLSLMENRVNVLEARIKGADPRAILKRGYSLALSGTGVPMKGVLGCSEGDAVSVMFADGTLDCRVEKVRRN